MLPEPSIDYIPPGWWNELKENKLVVHVTQGTIANNPDDLIIPTLQALANEDLLVVATTGGKPIETIKLTQIPTNARIETFIPHYHLLPHVDVMITNGGYGGVQMALAHGIPLIAAGKSEDKPEICALIKYSGVGINLKTKTPTPTQIIKAFKQLMLNTNYQKKAQFIQSKMQSLDAPTIAVNLLQNLAATKQPIFRND